MDKDRRREQRRSGRSLLVGSTLGGNIREWCDPFMPQISHIAVD